MLVGTLKYMKETGWKPCPEYDGGEGRRHR
jgi:hypothetical protein